jgi:circadian clock protein KaiC
MTAEVPVKFGELQLSFYNVSFLTDNIILLRYVEIESRLTLVLAVVKMRSSKHSRQLREYQITEDGIVLGGEFADYTAVLSGLPVPAPGLGLVGLRLDDERQVIQTLLERANRPRGRSRQFSSSKKM